jgi:metallo-beta-lactamase family protein
MTGTLRFFGAVRNVTGSKHLLEWKGETVLLDCGMIQGRRQESYEANLRFPIEAQALDHMVLSHAHIDHCGILPVLVREGYRGKIWCTRGTKDLARILLEDSANIQEGDAAWLARKRNNHQKVLKPLYTVEDAKKCFPRFKGVDYYKKVELSENIMVEFVEAGHILGSAMVVLTLKDGSEIRKLAFTGDHGRPGQVILKDPARLPEVDYLICESTYGGRHHPDVSGIEEMFVQLIHEQVEKGGRILIPAFAVGRTQAILYFLSELQNQGRIPELKIFVDSPLASKATQIVSDHPECFDGPTRKLIEKGQNPFFFKNLRYVREAEESKGLNKLKGPLIIIAASGMCENGRIVHHLKHSLENPNALVLIAGWQAQHTLGRRLIRGDRTVRIHGDSYEVRARVLSIPGASAHGDEDEMVENLRHLAPTLRRTYVVHGEESASLKFAERLGKEGFEDVVVPNEGERYDLP